MVWSCLLLNVTIRDSFPPLAFAYYATPPLVVAVFSLMLAWYGRRNREASTLWLNCNRTTAALGILCMVYWGYSSFRMGTPPSKTAETVSLMFWNVGRGEVASWDRIADEVQLINADVVAMAEVTAPEAQAPEFWETRLPGYTAVAARENLMLLVKGQTRETAHGNLASRGYYRVFSTRVQNETFQVLLADLASNPFRSRNAPLKQLFELIQKQRAIPTVVVGDFNTPPTSVCFDEWRHDWTRAWDVSGAGYGPTWPQPLPLLAIDHIWGNRQIAFRHCRGRWSRCSDHRPVIVEFEVRSTSE